MKRELTVAFLPGLLANPDLTECAVVVTDVLRASTTMIAALYQGARDVIPVAEIPDAIAMRDRLRQFGLVQPHDDNHGDVILGGERRGVIIPGFDYGNSPLEFTRDVINRKRLILCTTNGTVAVERCRGAKRVLIGALVNVEAVAETVADEQRLAVVCAGTAGKITLEDVLFAGALIDRLQSKYGGPWMLDDQATMAQAVWSNALRRVDAGESLADQLAQTLGGRNLADLGYHADIEYCAELDTLPLVPELDQTAWLLQQRTVSHSR
ncbi:MAG TPA: 2-phosphosulfolactate phosphatase [Pirellulaceae bacterium]|nr:2-phosphosulfolactate phosphatase [Pirellulaceae bacterium]